MYPWGPDYMFHITPSICYLSADAGAVSNSKLYVRLWIYGYVGTAEVQGKRLCAELRQLWTFLGFIPFFFSSPSVHFHSSK